MNRLVPIIAGTIGVCLAYSLLQRGKLVERMPVLRLSGLTYGRLIRQIRGVSQVAMSLALKFSKKRLASLPLRYRYSFACMFLKGPASLRMRA